MPYFPHTPESLLPRSDSKNPAATCRGLTNNGRPCRRAISKTPQSSPGPNSPNPSSQREPSPEAFCWQHQEQASAHASPTSKRLKTTTIKERTSIDTLADRLGLLEFEAKKEPRNQRRKPVPPPDPEKLVESIEIPTYRPERRKSRMKQRSNLGLFCCIGEADEYKRAPRPIKNNNGGRTTAHLPVQKRSTMPYNKPLKDTPNRPLLAQDPLSRTGEFLSLIPKSASPQTTALLLAELAKPVSDFDDEGFIYMFWLTPESLPSPPPSETASSLLIPPSRPIPGQRRTSEVISAFATNLPHNLNTPNKKTILLKIGRAQNVQRRLNQWTRQCGYNLSLIRYYPYKATLSGNSGNDVPQSPRKVPNAHKVERLIHIELIGNGMREEGAGKCETCGREHREWFSVEGSREGVRRVDEIIRRWVEWGERQIIR